MSDNPSNINDNTGIGIKPKKRRFFLKVFLTLIILCVCVMGALPFIFSEDRIVRTIEQTFKDNTGLTLHIDDVDIMPFNGHIIIKDVKALTSTGKVVGLLEEAALKLGIIDAYNLYMSNTIHMESLTIHNLRLTEVPYIEVINDISPKTANAEYNKAIAKFVEHTIINASDVYLEQLTPDKIHYNIQGNFDGLFSGGGSIEGEINGISSNNFNNIRLSGAAKDFNFNINDKDIKSTYSGMFDLEGTTCNFTGTLVSFLSPLKILNATPETHYYGSGSWDFKNKVITIPDVLITNPDGLSIKASGVIKNPTKKDKLMISAVITDSLAQIQDFSLPDDSHHISLNEGFSFIGKVYISPEKLDIRGHALAKNLTVSKNKDSQINAKVSTDFVATKTSLLFENIDLTNDDTELTGSLYFPTTIFNKKHNSIYDLTSLEVNLTVDGEMKDISQKLYTLGYYSESSYLPKGDISCKLVMNPDGENNSNFKLSLGSNDQNASLEKINVGKITLGRFSGNFQGNFDSSGNITLDQITLKSIPLNLNAKASNTSNQDLIITEFDVNIDLASLTPVLPKHFSSASSIIRNMVLSGKGKYNLKNSDFTMTDSLSEIHLSNSNSPAFLRVEGPLTLKSDNNWLLKLPDSKISVFNSDTMNSTQTIGCSAVLNLEATLVDKSQNGNLYFSPSGTATLGIRSKDSTLLKLISRLSMQDNKAFSIGSSILRTKLSFNNNTIKSLTQLSANDVIVINPIAFTEESLNATASLEYHFLDNKLKVQELKISDNLKGYEYTAAGNIYLDNNIFESFTSKLTADLSLYLPHFKGYGETQLYSGNIEIFSELTGTATSPSLTLVGKSDKISVTRFGVTNTAIEPKFDAQLSWSRDMDGSIHNLKAEEIFLKSSNGAIYLTGISERFKFEKAGVVNFGKGCDIDISVKGNRKLLWLLLPHYSSTDKDEGNSDSITMSANLKAEKMPLFTFEQDLKKHYLDQVSVSNGNIKIDKVKQGNITVDNISADFSLINGIAELTNGKAKLQGDVTFNTRTDLRGEVPSGTVDLNLTKIDLANLASRISSDSKVLNGWLSLPSDSPNSSLQLTWSGKTNKEILRSLSSKRERATIKDLVIETINKRHDWYKYLSVDFPPAFAKEVAKHIDQKLSPTYGKKKKSYYKYFDMEYKLSKNAIRINNIKCGGGNTADLLIRGIIAYDGRLKLRIYAVDNIQKLIDMRKLLDIPSIQGMTATLTPRERATFYRIIPSTIDRLAKENKVFVDVTGTVDEPEVNIDNLRAEIRRNIPYLIKRFNDTVGKAGLLQLLLKDIKSDKIRNALGANGSESSLKSGSSIGDLIKLID